MFQKSLKKGCNNLYFHLHNFYERHKPLSFLTSLSRRGPVNPSTQTFGNINLTEAMDVIFLLLGIRSKTTARISICTLNTLKLPSNQVHLKPVSRRCLATLSNHTFANVNLAKMMAILLIVWKMTEKGCNDLYFHSCTFNMSCKSFFFLRALSPRGYVNSSTPIFSNINLTETGIDLILDSNFYKK